MRNFFLDKNFGLTAEDDDAIRAEVKTAELPRLGKRSINNLAVCLPARLSQAAVVNATLSLMRDPTMIEPDVNCC